MMRYRWLAGVVCFGLSLLFCSPSAWAQASVDESQETARLYVDAAQGADSNPGTRQKPLQTIGKAASLAESNNQQGVGTKVIINPGTYREAVLLHGTHRDSGLPITFQAASKGTAVVSGSDIWTGWKPSQGDSRKYVHSWPYQWGLCPLDGGGAPLETDIARRREMIFVNGMPLTQVLSHSAMRVNTTFYVDESGGRVYLWPPDGTDMSQAKVEVATREVVLDIGLKTNVVLRGLTFQHASSCRGDMAVSLHGSSNLLLDKVSFYWNNAAGLKLQNVYNTTVQNSLAEHNGTSGMKGSQTKFDLWQNNRAYYNDWRGAQGVYYKWGEGGFHFWLAHNQTLRDMRTSWNQTTGIHWDTDNHNDTADSIVASQNLMSGTVVERTQGPMTISNSRFCNGKPLTGPTTFGFQLRNSSNVTLTGSYIRGSRNELAITGDPGGWEIVNWETGQKIVAIDKNFTFTNNTIEAGADEQTFNDGLLGGSDWNLFRNTLTSDYNTWWKGGDTMAFYVPTPDPWTKVDFPGWQGTSGADEHSVWKAPGDPGHCNMSPDGPDFWFVMNFTEGWQTVNRGASVIFTGYVVPLAFSGTVTLQSDGVQNIPGASAKWSPGQIVNSGTATFTVATSPSTPRGTYPITLIANSGNLTRTMTAMVIVN
jgi:hypothetical protein